MLIRPGRLLNSGISNNPIKKTLKLAGLGYLASNVTYKFHPADAPQGKEHYLYERGIGWSASRCTITGTMAATGVVSGGTFSYIAPTTVVETYTITWANGGSPVTSFCIGFDRALTTAERAALGQAAFWALLFAGTGILVADCTGESGQAITVDGTAITVDGGVVTASI